MPQIFPYPNPAPIQPLRVIFLKHRSEHAIPLLIKHQWLAIAPRSNYKVLFLAFKALHNLAPPNFLVFLHLAPRHTLFDAVVLASWLFQEQDTHCLSWFLAFSLAAPKAWNVLHPLLWLLTSLAFFQSQLKSCFLQEAFPNRFQFQCLPSNNYFLIILYTAFFVYIYFHVVSPIRW